MGTQFWYLGSICWDSSSSCSCSPSQSSCFSGIDVHTTIFRFPSGRSHRTSNILAVAIGWGTAQAVKQGGECECVQKIMNGGCVHHQRARMWVTHDNTHKLLGIAFRSAAESPLDEFPLQVEPLILCYVLLLCLVESVSP